jgi:hypothetical protein
LAVTIRGPISEVGGAAVGVGGSVGARVGVGPAGEGLGDSVGLGVAVSGWAAVDAGDGNSPITGEIVALEVGIVEASTVGLGTGRGSHSGAPTARLTTARQAARPATRERENRIAPRRGRTIGRSGTTT